MARPSLSHSWLPVLRVVVLLSLVGCSTASEVSRAAPNAGSDAALPSGLGGGGGSGSGAIGGFAGNNIATGEIGSPSPCNSGVKTTVSGTVYDPAGRVPLYNVAVYVPSAALDPIVEGVTCDKCGGAGSASGKPVAATLTDAMGKFVLHDVPPGANVPLVMQVGKWRRQVSIPNVPACAETAMTDPNLTRLPRDHLEGNLPQMAISTGHADALECLLRKIGIADEEFTNDAGSGRVHLYYGGDLSGPSGGGAGANGFDAAHGGTAFSSAAALWGAPSKLMKYDLLLLSCEGGQYADAKKPYIANIKAYADMGGRMFTDHLHFYWLSHGPAPWPATANYIGVGKDLPSPFTSLIDMTFPKGMAFADWLVAVGATATKGQIQILQGQYSVQATTPPYTQQWIYSPHNPNDSGQRAAVQYMTMNTPAELATTAPSSQCGRVVFTDLHVVSAAAAGGAVDVSRPTSPFPTGCTTTGDLSAQEKALEFMFFDLASCVQPEAIAPTPPAIVN